MFRGHQGYLSVPDPEPNCQMKPYERPSPDGIPKPDRTLFSDTGRVAEFDHHHFLATLVVGQGVRSHDLQRRRIDVQRFQVGIAFLQIRYLMLIVVLFARYTTRLRIM